MKFLIIIHAVSLKYLSIKSVNEQFLSDTFSVEKKNHLQK